MNIEDVTIQLIKKESIEKLKSVKLDLWKLNYNYFSDDLMDAQILISPAYNGGRDSIYLIEKGSHNQKLCGNKESCKVLEINDKYVLLQSKHSKAFKLPRAAYDVAIV